MGKAHSDDLRKRVVAAMATGRMGVAFDVAPSTAGNWWRRYRSESSHAARPTGGDRRSKLLDQAGWIGERLADGAQAGAAAQKGMIFATEQDRPDVAVAREIWRIAQAGLDFTSLVFVDETGTMTSMTRLRGWGQKGKPLPGKAPHGQ